ncbi:MAG TPA: phosphatase PAP2 family protein, partial [Anaerolineaceae bacterium]|nr:phosphatase PAP2 family protein [Anaerolineaceae bacterium]
MEAIWNFEITITLFLQSLGSWLTVPMKAFTFLGQEEFFMLILPALYWCINPGLGIQVGALLMLSTSINGYFKMAMHGARPYWFNTAVKPGVFETSFGMPSGHAMNSMSIWGLIGSFLKSTRGKVLAGLVILFIGLSRIYLGVHFTSDVLVGWALGAVLLFVFIRWQRPVTAWAKKLSLAGQVVVSLISALALVVINALVVALFGSWVVPETWVQNAALANPDELIAPYSVTGILTSAGTWF